MIVAAFVVCIVYAVTGTASQWWLWMLALLIMIIIDACLGIVQHRVIKFKTKTEYVKK